MYVLSKEGFNIYFAVRGYHGNEADECVCVCVCVFYTVFVLVDVVVVLKKKKSLVELHL